jgi:hypothetical protein
MTDKPTLTAARQVADAVLYEGYLLYPYRASSPKNQVRWQFGILGPEGAAAAGVGEEPTMSAEVVVESERRATLDVYLRFLQVQSRVVERRTDDDGWSPVDELLVSGSHWIAYHEAVSREVPLLDLSLDELGDGKQTEIAMRGGQEVEELHEDGKVVGRLVRTRWPLSGTVSLSTRRGHDDRLLILTVGVSNDTSWTPGVVAGSTPRDVAAGRARLGKHRHGELYAVAVLAGAHRRRLRQRRSARRADHPRRPPEHRAGERRRLVRRDRDRRDPDAAHHDHDR